jgi:hypothetical protein
VDNRWKSGSVMVVCPPYPPESWIPEIPFDFDWMDKPNPYPGGIFKDEADRMKAEARAGRDLSGI